MMADLDDPPRSRWRGLLIGLVASLPIVFLFVYFVLPFLWESLNTGARELEARLRQEDAYMKALCMEAIELPRDESLCKCALATEAPSLDCRPVFNEWTLHRQFDQCSNPENAKQARAFCACVNAVIEQVEAVEPKDSATDPLEKRKAAQRYVACTELDDALYLPTVEALQTTK